MSDQNYEERCRAIHLLRSDWAPRQVAEGLGRSLSWVYKWQARYEQDGWEGLRSQSRTPRHLPPPISESVKQAIRETRSRLEAEARQPDKLSYVGAPAIRQRLRQQQIAPLPSISSIERELRAAGMVRPRQTDKEPEVDYPHLRPERPHQVVQVDIVPHYLTGGQSVACFNALDVVSRYPTGRPLAQKRAQDARRFLLQVWQDLGIPTYTQMDNESCFSGGFTHPHVLGQVLRLGLWVGTQTVYIPFYHPESNGHVERFHQDYNRHTWDKIDLPDLTAAQTHSASFFAEYRHSHHHSALNGQSPAQRHSTYSAHALPTPLSVPKHLPLTAGKVHFIRRVKEQGTIRVLNMDWPVPSVQPNDGVWATLQLSVKRATLAIFDRAPGDPQRRCLTVHPFPLKEPVLPLQECFRPSAAPTRFWAQLLALPLRWFSTMF